MPIFIGMTGGWNRVKKQLYRANNQLALVFNKYFTRVARALHSEPYRPTLIKHFSIECKNNNSYGFFANEYLPLKSVAADPPCGIGGGGGGVLLVITTGILTSGAAFILTW